MEGKVEPLISDLIGRVEAALAEDDAEMSALRQQLSITAAELEKERNENLEARKALLQLPEVQEQLEYYFNLCRKQSEMLEASAALQARSVELFLNANP